MNLFGEFIKRVAYPLNELREGTGVLGRLRSLEATQYADPDEFEALRLRKLRAVLEHAFRHTAFYRKRFEEAGIVPEDIRNFDDLTRLPPLTKEDIVAHQDDLIADNIRPGDLHQSTTGGSTGIHTPFYRDNKCRDIKLAAQFRFNRWCGWDVGRNVALVWPAFQDLYGRESWKYRLRHAMVDRHLILDASRLNEAVMQRHARTLNRFAPVLICAFPNPLAVLAAYIRDATRYRIRPAGVLTTAEPLLSSQRQLFQQVFDCPVFNCYASRESGHIACECEMHQDLHVNAECLHLEFERDGRPVGAGEPGRVLVTDFENYGMPFIRYDIGDVGIPLAGSCSCGRTLPRIKMEAGRISDFLLSPHDGSLIAGTLCLELADYDAQAGQFQIVQDARDHLTIRVTRTRRTAFTHADTTRLEEAIQRVFHGAMRVTFEMVESISREKSGKSRVCINRYVESHGIPGDTIPV
ncbi:MAG: phenylacetate--CoA ligase family protein [Planctomycetes bacterium]|nr:phenylacetate--CoA ligase family protein [Planctomycetota bacterium]